MLGSRCADCNSFLRRSNFYPADFLPEPPNLSFKELCQLWHELIAGETPTMRNSSPSKLALWMEYSFADLDNFDLLSLSTISPKGTQQ
jgi:hypothetical protein